MLTAQIIKRMSLIIKKIFKQYKYIEGQPKKKNDILWPIIVAKKLLSWPTIGFLIQKKTTIGKMSLIVGHLCPEKNDDNIVGTQDRQ